MEYPLYKRVPQSGGASNEELLDLFLDYVNEQKLSLYGSQEAAILELFEEKNVILNTPTGSGKSLVAAALHFKSLSQGKKSVYTCPIKALVNEKFFALCRDFGPDQVGMSTGDATVNKDAPILCCTAEVLANIALREGAAAPVDDVIMDEFHYYSDRERGVAWQTPLLTMPQTRFLLMSATLGNTVFFENVLTELNGSDTVTVSSRQRPVPLEYEYSDMPLDKTVELLVSEGKAPVYLVHFTQLDCAESAQNFLSLNFCTREEKNTIAQEIEGFKFSTPYGPDIRKFLKNGIGLHHAGLLPKYRVLVEQLARKGLLKIICGTDTLGVGINVPIRTVLFTRLCKFDGQKTTILSARDYHQISGRAGRKGYDDRGWVVVQAPEYVIDNLQQERKFANDPHKLKKVVKQKPPEKNFIAWNKDTFNRLIQASPEPLVSRFQVSHGMLLNVLSRQGDGCLALQKIIQRCHDSPKQKKEHVKRAWQLFRALVERKIIEFIPPMPDGTKLRVNVDLQADFSLDQTLSLYLVDTIPLLDPEAPDYSMDLLTLVESILENPDIILRRQLDRIRDEKMAEMKMEGLDYNARMDELEKLEYPKPKREFVYTTFNEFTARHPWVGQENIRPKSIAREMYEGFMSFADYIKSYSLQKTEGVLLRHISSVYKVLSQTVPDSAKIEAVQEMEAYFGALVRQVDSSLLDEWERMRNPDYKPREEKEVAHPNQDEAGLDITRNPTQFTTLLRAPIFMLIRALATDNYEAVLETLDDDKDLENQPWTDKRLQERLDAYFQDHERICLDPEARNRRHTYIKVAEDKRSWLVQQVLVDPEAANDWMVEFYIDLIQSRQAAKPWLRLSQIKPVGA